MKIRINDRAAEGLRKYAGANCVTADALLEALGCLLDDGEDHVLDAAVVERAAWILGEDAEIEAEERSRFAEDGLRD